MRWLGFSTFLLVHSAHAVPVIGIIPTDDIDNGYSRWVEQFGATAKRLPHVCPAWTQTPIFARCV